MTVTLILPYPVSANLYWRSRWVQPRGGAGFIQHYLSADAKAYKEEAEWRARQAGVRQPLVGRLWMTLTLYPHRPQDAAKRMREHGPQLWDDTVQCIDLGNAEKVTSDALNGIVYTDDKQLWRIESARAEPDGDQRLVVTVRTLPPRQTVQGDLL